MIKQLTLSDLQARALVSFELNHDEETAWVELKRYFKEEKGTTIPECGIKGVFLNVLKTLQKRH